MSPSPRNSEINITTLYKIEENRRKKKKFTQTFLIFSKTWKEVCCSDHEPGYLNVLYFLQQI